MVVIEAKDYGGIKVTLTDSGIRTIFLSRIKRNHSWTIKIFEDITNIINDAAIDGDRTKLVYITGGSRKIFSSGNDVLNYFPKDETERELILGSSINTIEKFFSSFISFPKISMYNIVYKKISQYIFVYKNKTFTI